MPLYNNFPITGVCRQDLEEIGFDASAIGDAAMARLAEKMADDYCGQLFWPSLETIAESIGIARREPSRR